MPTDLHQPHPERPRWAMRIVWFVALWLSGLGAVSALTYVLRLWIAPH